MKHKVITELLTIARQDKRFIFLTGDLGFNALEPLQKLLGKRFINAGVAEQNMVDVAAGMARMGLHPWVYSITPFLTLKTVEQIRNTICHLNLPVRFIGYGGGYGYGIMGEAHHALEDIAIFSSLPHMKIYTPALGADIKPVIHTMNTEKNPSYIRLNIVPQTIQKKVYAAQRKFRQGNRLTIVALGYLIHAVLEATQRIPEKNALDVWAISELPFRLSASLRASIKATKKLLVVEEHGYQGGLGEEVFAQLTKQKIPIEHVEHIYAKGYPSKLYGSHLFHLKENRLDSKGILHHIRKML